MPTYHPPFPPPPQPTKIFFDPFNSSATGHQRAKNRLSGSTSWRDSRTYKLAHQLNDYSGRGGNQHLADLVGAGSEYYGKDGRKENGDWEKDAPGLRENGWQDIRTMLDGTKKRNIDELSADEQQRVSKKLMKANSHSDGVRGSVPTNSSPPAEIKLPDRSKSASKMRQIPPQIFRSLVLYLNGSTGPLVSDHRLKQLWVQHGGALSIALGRRSVTHVVLGDSRSGGGGLASSKIQKEVARVGGKGVKYVSVQWVLDCIERGKRVSEAGYGVVEGRVGGSGQASVRNLFSARPIAKGGKS